MPLPPLSPLRHFAELVVEHAKKYDSAFREVHAANIDDTNDELLIG